MASIYRRTSGSRCIVIFEWIASKFSLAGFCQDGLSCVFTRGNIIDPGTDSRVGEGWEAEPGITSRFPKWYIAAKHQSSPD
jgi:hypothetical protein